MGKGDEFFTKKKEPVGWTPKNVTAPITVSWIDEEGNFVGGVIDQIEDGVIYVKCDDGRKIAAHTKR
jgi:hypothetical protein